MKIVFSKEELSQIFNQRVLDGISGVCLNSKEAKEGDLFIALKGDRVDGHDFIGDALECGASLALSQKEIEGVPSEKLIQVPSTYAALLQLAKYNMQLIRDVKYIAVTGSVGKTTTKDIIYHILSQNIGKQFVYASKKNYNSQIGLPVCAALMPRETKLAIFEMGMSEKGNIKKLAEIVNPDIAVITTIGENHLEFFESPFDIAKAKSEIFEKSPNIGIIPCDSPYADFLKNKALDCNVKNVILFGENKKSDARILSYEFCDNGIVVEADIMSNKVRYKLYSANVSYIHNSVAAISAAYAASGINPQALADTISSFISKRCEIVHANGITVIDDSYNAAPLSMKSALQTLGAYKNGGRKIAVLGDMLELGSDAVFLHENLAPTIAKYGIDLVFACGDLSRRLFDNLLESKKGDWKKNSKELSESILKDVKDGDCILVKGSHSMNMGCIVDALKNSFSN